jgi:hypothetical protein
MKIYHIAKSIILYRGESVYNKGGNYWTTDKEWARNFTQSGLDKEIKVKSFPEELIYVADKLPSAVNESEIDNAILEAKKKGFKAIWVNEGAKQPNSVLMVGV